MLGRVKLRVDYKTFIVFVFRWQVSGGCSVGAKKEWSKRDEIDAIRVFEKAKTTATENRESFGQVYVSEIVLTDNVIPLNCKWTLENAVPRTFLRRFWIKKKKKKTRDRRISNVPFQTFSYFVLTMLVFFFKLRIGWSGRIRKKNNRWKTKANCESTKISLMSIHPVIVHLFMQNLYRFCGIFKKKMYLVI